MTFGIISGCNKDYEWLLPWWWENYKKHNSYPVVIFDFGMSEDGKKFCIDRGIYCDLQKIDKNIVELSCINEDDRKIFKIMYGNERAEKLRSVWFKKPQAAYHTPFDITVWIDLDCEIGLNLAELSSILKPDEEIALRPEPDKNNFFLICLKNNYIDETSYNSGVFVFRKNSYIINEWLDLSFNQNSLFGGDQEALCRAIYLKKCPVKLLPERFNKLEFDFEFPKQEIRHFAGEAGKELIKKIT